MLTTRGWMLLLIVFFMLGVAVFGRHPHDSIGFLGMTIGLWFAWEWLSFSYRARILVRRLQVRRELGDERGSVDALWARQVFHVKTVFWLPAGPRFPYIRVSERLPFMTEHVAGATWFEGALAAGQAIELAYDLRCDTIGGIRFEGARVQLADLHGLFYFATFLPKISVHRVLPPLADARGRSPTVKRHNLLLPPGIHRMHRPGGGSELLDLRDYMPGDPPKTIAWKASARRDRLITKEFESEVPVRCTLFLDTSQSVRLGRPGESALHRLSEIAAGVAQAAAGVRDLTGLCLFDDKETTQVRPARGPRHLAKLIRLLADVAGLGTTLEAKVEELLPPPHAFAREVYPELLRSDVNSVPSWLPWLFPRPSYTLRKATVADWIYQRLPILLVVYLIVAGISLVAVFFIMTLWAGSLRPGMEGFVRLGVLGLALFGMILSVVALPGFLFPQRRRLHRWRKQMAALLSVRHGLGAGGLAMLMEDDDRFVVQLHRFMVEHHIPFPSPGNDEKPPLSNQTGKVDVLSRALLRAVSKGHDNELFVLMADLLRIPELLDPLVKAVMVATARHHQVMIICPWPAGMRPPSDSGERGAACAPADDVVGRQSQERMNHGFQQIRRTFARLSVPVICARSEDTAGLILDRMDRLRMMGRRR